MSGHEGRPPARTLRVSRSGGFAGLRVAGELDLDADDEPAATARELLDRVDFARLAQRPPQPDRYVYEFQAPDGQRVTVAEQDLTDELRRLAGLVLGR
jgi:hypothetical protein